MEISAEKTKLMANCANPITTRTRVVWERTWDSTTVQIHWCHYLCRRIKSWISCKICTDLSSTGKISVQQSLKAVGAAILRERHYHSTLIRLWHKRKKTDPWSGDWNNCFMRPPETFSPQCMLPTVKHQTNLMIFAWEPSNDIGSENLNNIITSYTTK